jgi:hypothetical protein
MAGPVRAQEFQIGGGDQRETSVALEDRPSLGLFVLGTVNGHGPYRFSISLIEHTQLTPAVVKDAGLGTQDKGVTADPNSNRYEQKLELTDATLRLGDKELPLNGAHVFPDDDPSGYAPVPSYGGILGVEVFRKGIVSLDLSHSRMVLSPQTNAAAPSGAIELPLEQSAGLVDLDRLPAVTLSLDGQPGRFRLGFFNSSVSFQYDSRLGQDLLDKSPHHLAYRSWTPNGIERSQSGTATSLLIGGQRGVEPIFISRSLDIPLLRHGSSSHANAFMHASSPVDGVIGLRVLSAFDITINDPAGKMWLAPRDKNSFPCRKVSRGNLHGTTGLSPWVYKGQGIVRSVAEGSPAEAAGIEPGDQILSIDDGDVFAYYDHQDVTCFAPANVKLVFHNSSGDHSVVLTPAEF